MLTCDWPMRRDTCRLLAEIEWLNRSLSLLGQTKYDMILGVRLTHQDTFCTL